MAQRISCGLAVVRRLSSELEWVSVSRLVQQAKRSGRGATVNLTTGLRKVEELFQPLVPCHQCSWNRAGPFQRFERVSFAFVHDRKGKRTE